MNVIEPRHAREFARLYRNHRYEVTDEGGILLGEARVTLNGYYQLLDATGEVVREGKNLITTEGANHILSAVLGGGTVYTTWYLAPFTTDVTPTTAWTAALFPATAGELTTQISEATRPVYTESVPAARSTTNDANPATITAAQANVIVRGVGLLSASAKGATTGVLLSAYKYDAAYTLPSAGNTAGLKHTLTFS